MQDTIQQGLREGVDKVWMNNALQLQNGWMHINGPRYASISSPFRFLIQCNTDR